MWYFSWILGTALALTFGVLNAIWYEIMDRPAGQQPESLPVRGDKSAAAPEQDS